MSKELAEIINRIRKEKNFSQELLSVRSGLDRTYISHLLNGRRRFNEDILFKLAKALNVHPTAFFWDVKSSSPVMQLGIPDDEIKDAVKKLHVEFCTEKPLSRNELYETLRVGMEIRRRMKKGKKTPTTLNKMTSSGRKIKRKAKKCSK